MCFEFTLFDRLLSRPCVPKFETREPLPNIAPNKAHLVNTPLDPVDESGEAASAPPPPPQQQRVYPYAPQEYEPEPEGHGGEGGDAETREPPLAPPEFATLPEQTGADRHPEQFEGTLLEAEPQEGNAGLLEGAQFADGDVDADQMGAGAAPATDAQEQRQQVAFITERPPNACACESSRFTITVL